MEVKIFDNSEKIALTVGELFIELLNSKPKAVLGLATGATPVPVYNFLIDQHKKNKVSFIDATSFNLDEYCDLPQNDKNSYYSFMQENLFRHIDIKPENIHIPDGNAKDIEDECRKYDKSIAIAGGIDLQLLGIGTNAHIGFNEPSNSFSDGTFKVKLSESTIKSNSIYFTENTMPHYAITMGIGSIMKAKKIVLIATGSSKAKAVKDMIEGDVSPACPASILQKHDNSVIYIDKQAASLLS